VPEVRSDHVVKSNPPDEHYRVINIFVNKNTGKLVVQYEEEEKK